MKETDAELLKKVFSRLEKCEECGKKYPVMTMEVIGNKFVCDKCSWEIERETK